MHKRLNDAITSCQQRLQHNSFFLSRLGLVLGLFCLYIAMAVLHALDLLFLSPQTSFERFNPLDETRGYTGSYMSHRRWKHNVRFGTLSYSLVLVTSVVMTTLAVQFFDTNSVKPVFAATQSVNTSDTTNDGVCNAAHCSIVEAINAVNVIPGSQEEDIQFDPSVGDGTYIITLTGQLPTVNRANVTLHGDNKVRLDCNNLNISALLLAQPNITIDGFDIRNCGVAGITANSVGATPTIRNSQFTANTSGVRLDGQVDAGGEISQNSFENNIGPGIDIQGRNGLTITNNDLGGNLVGIRLNSVTTSTIQSNTVYDNTENGIEVVGGSDDNTIDSNTIGRSPADAEAGNDMFGIRLENATNNTISDNIIRHSGGDGMNIQSSSTNRIAGNTIDDNAGQGVFFQGTCTSNVIGFDDNDQGKANTITNNGSGGIYTLDTNVTGTIWRLNTFNENTVYAISLDNDANGAIAVPGITSFLDIGLQGRAELNAELVDIYNAPSTGIWTYIDTVAADAESQWEYTGDFSNIDRIAVMQTNGGRSSAFVTAVKSDYIQVTAVEAQNITATSAQIAWTASEAALGGVRYSTNSADIEVDGGTEVDADQGSTPNTSFTAQLSNLEPATTYYYRAYVHTEDNSEQAKSTVLSFTTEPAEADDTAPVIQSVSASSITKDSVVLSVETDVSTTAKFDLGTTTNYGTTQRSQTVQEVHTVTFSNLSPNTTYHYRIVVTDTDDDQDTSSDQTFATLRIVEDSINTISITSDDFEKTVVGGDDVDVNVPLQTLEFGMSNVATGNIVQFVVEKYNKKTETAVKEIVNKKKAADEKNKVNFTVKKKQLDLGQAYLVSTGLENPNNAKKNVALSKRFTFTPQYPGPQLVFPKPQFGDALIVNSIPEEFIAYAPDMPTGSTISFNIVNTTDGALQVRCAGSTGSDKLASCRMPFFPAAGVYTLQVTSADGDSIASDLELIVADGVSDVISVDPRSGQRITTATSPTLSFIKYKSGSTLSMEASFLSGPYVLQGASADNGGAVISGSSQFTLFEWPKGTFELHVTEKMPNGKVIQDYKIKGWAVHKAVQPGVVSPANNSRHSINDTINLTVASPDDYKIQLFQSINGTDRLVFETVAQNGGATINLNEFIGQRTGTQNFKLRGISPAFFKSAFTPFSIVTYKPAPVKAVIDSKPDKIVPPEETVTTPETDLTKVDTDGDGIPDVTDTDPGIVVEPLTPDELTGDLPDADADGIPDIADDDIDGDGITNTDEATLGTDSSTTDSDGDGMTDGDEVDADSNPTDVDTDGDGLGDGLEAVLGTDPGNPDTDGDGINDGVDAFPLDSNNGDETDLDTDSADTDSADTDDDGLTDGTEDALGTNPHDDDSDDDGINDAQDGTYDYTLPDEQTLTDEAQADASEYYQNTGTETPTDYHLTEPVISLTDEQTAAVTDSLTQQIADATEVNVIPGENVSVTHGDVIFIKTKRIITISDIIAWLLGRLKKAVNDTTIVLSGVIEVSQDGLPIFLNQLPTVVSATVFSEPVVQIAQAQIDGKWTMTVPAEFLTTGEHTLYAASEINGVNGGQVEIARFVIEQETELSKTTWLVIVNVGIALLALIVSIFLQLRRRTKLGGLTNGAD